MYQLLKEKAISVSVGDDTLQGLDVSSSLPGLGHLPGRCVVRVPR